MPKETEKQVEKSNFNSLKDHRNWLYGLLAVLVAMLLIGFGSAVGRHGEFGNDDGFKTPPHLVKMYRQAGGGYMGGHMGGGGTVTLNGQTRTEGVVTSVSGNSFTIAGNGSTTNVTTNSSTQYKGGNQVKQNDTVRIQGTTSNGMLTATFVEINP